MGIAELKAIGLNYWQNPRVKQIMMLFSVNLAGIPVAIVTNILLTHFLGPTHFGDYQFLDNFFNFTILIASFGFFQAANRALVLNHDKEKARQYYGATFVILIALFLVMAIALIIYSHFDANLKEKHLEKILLFSIPFSWVYLSISYFEVLFQADNRMNLLATSRLMPKICLLIAIVIVYVLFVHSNINKLWLAWALYMCVLVTMCAYVFFSLKLSFRNLRGTIREIWAYNKSYGFHVYVGAAFSVGVAQLTPVIISYFGVNNSGVGFYALALALANPLQFIPNTIATTNYKEFASNKKIPAKLTKVTLVLTLLALIVLWVLVPPFVKIFFGSKFESVIYLNFVVSIGIALYGIADYYNRFIGAQGHGKLLRNTSFIVGSLILVFNFILIPRMGANGAVITRLLGGLTYLLCVLYYYKKIVTINIANQ
ncbi:MAG TPA: oligosaccharide flippase family protein [Mucilaginibacter sp.]|nr:oligosaccharide flippase family protein [Mucilaginibacter sp.]